MAEQTVAEMIAVALGWKPQQAERLMRDMDSPDVRVSFDWEEGATMEGAVGCAIQGDKFVAAVRAFDAATQPNPKEPEPVSEEGEARIVISFNGGPLDGVGGIAPDTRPLELDQGTYRYAGSYEDTGVEMNWEPREGSADAQA